MPTTTEQDIERAAAAVNDTVQCSRRREAAEAYLTRHVTKAVLRAVADLNHLDVAPGARPSTFIKAILDERFGEAS
jgi:hypothetical protein